MANAEIARLSRMLVAGALCLSAAFGTPAAADDRARIEDGIITMKSDYSTQETVERLKAEIVRKGIRLFGEVDQAGLAAGLGIDVRPSVLLMFGNPALGAQFIKLNPLAGLDWPVRVLVRQDGQGAVWVSYTDFANVARRYRIAEGDPAFATASSVVASITSKIRAE